MAANLKPGPVTRVCHVCGRQYGLSSFEIHLKQCKKLWVQTEELKPKNERRPIPKTPPGLGQGGGGESNKGMSREEVEAMNRAAQEAYNVHGMEKCEFCGRTFAEGRLAIHNKSCRADNVGRKVTEGAAPRNKKEEVDYGRVRKPREDNSSAETNGESSGGGHSPQRPSSSAGGSRALSGSLPSNRKKDAAARIQSPLEQTVDTASLAQELQGNTSMISVIQAKLDRWEASTLATLQEIKDLKEVFAQLSTS